MADTICVSEFGSFFTTIMHTKLSAEKKTQKTLTSENYCHNE